MGSKVVQVRGRWCSIHHYDLYNCTTTMCVLENIVFGCVGKAWRWVGEMEELSKAFVDVGLPGGFHDGAADLYSRMTQYKDVPPASAPDALEVTETLLKGTTKPKL